MTSLIKLSVSSFKLKGSIYPNSEQSAKETNHFTKYLIFTVFISHLHPVLKRTLLFTVAETDFSFPIYQILQYLCRFKNENELRTE